MIRISNARLPQPSGGEKKVTVDIVDGMLGTCLQQSPGVCDQILDAEGLLLLPGIVDIHGDAFEKQLMPRPQVFFPFETALLETDRQLLANGITTAFHGVTCTWEPGLRSMENAGRFMDIFRELEGHLACDHRVHLRYEITNAAATEQVQQWLESDRIYLFSFNDHAERLRKKAGHPASLTTLLARTGMSRESFLNLVDSADYDDASASALQNLAAICRTRGIPMASHDDPDEAARQRFHQLGCTICEFPENEETAAYAVSLGNEVVMGAPNILRGRSHFGMGSAREFIARGLCTVLSSDYAYPSLLAAPFILAAEGTLSLAEAWDYVSRNPARAVGMADRGSLEEQKRADLLLVDDRLPRHPRAVAVLVSGVVRLLTEPARLCSVWSRERKEGRRQKGSRHYVVC